MKLSNKELKNYYDKNRSKFNTKEYRSVETLLLDANKYAETITVKDLIIKYRDEIVPEHKARVSTTHKLNKLMRYDEVSSQFLLRLKSSNVYKMQQKMKHEGLAPKTINVYVQLLIQIWNTAKRIWAINVPAQSPFELVTLQKVNNERDRVLTPGEYSSLLEKAPLRATQ